MFKSTINKIKDWCFHSEVVFIGYLKIIFGVIVAAISSYWDAIQHVVQDPTVMAALDKLNLPNYVGIGLAILGSITIWARLRRVEVTEDNRLTGAPKEE